MYGGEVLRCLTDGGLGGLNCMQRTWVKMGSIVYTAAKPAQVRQYDAMGAP